MYPTHCVPFDRCKFTIPITLEKGPSFSEIPTSLKPKDERTCCFFMFDIALVFYLCL